MHFWKGLLIFVTIAIHFGYGHPGRARRGTSPIGSVASRRGRLFDTYVTQHRPNRYERPSYQSDYGYNGYIMRDPDDFGLDYFSEGESIYCPPGFNYDGFTNPLESGLCILDTYSY
ncbi:unnamed protein product [Allacma fusca]|uniref:Uncharacterized protein n=1 Tax=Allacma fusca TaxID=39272 RepID=A0A8J2LIS4_9HEXA|nr:unnamed protein product [Allacma fusca]